MEEQFYSMSSMLYVLGLRPFVRLIFFPRNEFFFFVRHLDWARPHAWLRGDGERRCSWAAFSQSPVDKETIHEHRRKSPVSVTGVWRGSHLASDPFLPHH